MALPSSPPIDLRAIQIEFGAPAGTDLLALRRGGAYVPNTPANANVPTAAPIDILDFLGASASSPISVYAPNAFASDFTTPYFTTSSSTVQVTNGAGARTYLWERISGATNITIGNANTATATFTCGTSIPGIYTMSVRVTVTDSTGSASHTISVDHQHGNL